MSDGYKPTEEEVAAKPWVKEPDRFVDAHDCLRLRFVGSAAELRGDETFTPQYVHQIFTDEAIELPPASRPLKLEVLYTAASLELWFRSADDAEPPADEAMDALYSLAAQLPAPCASLAAFLQRAEAPFDPAALCGELLQTYTLTPRAGDAAATPAELPRSYSVYCGTVGAGGCARRGFAERVQSIYRWCIEGYSSIDLDDER